MLKLSVLSFAVIGFAVTSSTFATDKVMSADSASVVTEGSKLVIINENDKAATLEITAVNSDSKSLHKFELAAKETKEFVINSAMIDNNSLYNIKASTNALTSDNCKNLSVMKGYTITLTNDKVGTTCVTTTVSNKS